MDPIEINECYRRGLLKNPSVMQDSKDIEKSKLEKGIGYITKITEQIKGKIDYLKLITTKKLNYY